jgi:hypothetical protein
MKYLKQKLLNDQTFKAWTETYIKLRPVWKQINRKTTERQPVDAAKMMIYENNANTM